MTFDNKREYNVVVFGDSVTWGQGLLEEHKFDSILAVNIENLFDNVKVNKVKSAHSGAIIGVGDNHVEPAKPGEIPSGYPTILQQVASYPKGVYPQENARDPKFVDLVLIDGGINDIGPLNILFGDSKDVEEKTIIIFRDHLKELLKKVLEKFNTSRTKIMVTGYFPIVSQYSDVGVFRSLAMELAKVVKDVPGVDLLAKTVVFLGSLIAGLIGDSVLRDKAATNSRIFYNTSVSLSKQIIQELDPTRSKIFYYSLNLHESQSVFASDPCLWGVQPLLDVMSSDDEVKGPRKILCDNQPGMNAFDYFKCTNAGIAHPNYKQFPLGGAALYAKGIFKTLFPTPQSCIGFENEIRQLEDTLVNLDAELKDMIESHGLTAGIRKQIDNVRLQLKQNRYALAKCIHDYYNPPVPTPTPVISNEQIGTKWTAKNSDGRLEVFRISDNSSLYHIWQTSAGGSWSNWSGSGGSQLQRNSLTVGQNADGRLEVFVIGGDGSVYSQWQTSPGGSWSNWSGRGGSQFTGSNLSVARNVDGRLELFVIGGDGALYHIWQTSAGGSWSNWSGSGGSQLQRNSLTVGQNADGRLEVFVIGGDGSVYSQWQTSPGGSWSNWSGRGGSQFTGSNLSVARNVDGRLELFVIGGDGALYHIWQTSAGGSWSNWQSVGRV